MEEEAERYLSDDEIEILTLLSTASDTTREATKMLLSEGFPETVSKFVVDGVKTMGGFFHKYYANTNDGGGESLRFYERLGDK